jgi:hypothetical protein
LVFAAQDPAGDGRSGPEPAPDLVEVDDAAIVYRTKHDPIDGRQGRSPAGKLLIVGAVELSPDEERRPRRIRLQPIADVSGEVLQRFVDQVVQPGATVITDGLHSYGRMPNHERERHVIGRVKAHLVLHVGASGLF